jgi:hypothetical protein
MKQQDQYEEEKQKLQELKEKNQKQDTRVKTDDVTKTKGLSFEDFNLSKDLQLVRTNH